MTLLESTAVASGHAETVRIKLQNAPAPLKLADVVKGLKRPRGVKANDFQKEIRPILEEDVRLGLAFAYPSGKDNQLRYWSRDEKQLLREKALEIATQPQSLSTLKTKLGKEAKGVGPVFVDGVVRELISSDQLFEHPPRTKKSSPLFGSSPPPPPPPPLEQTKHKKTLGKLVTDCRKLVTAAGVTAQDVMQALHVLLGTVGSAEAAKTNVAAPQGADEPLRHGPILAPNGIATASVDDLILKAIANVHVLSLADLRRKMPPDLQGQIFDESVLRLADQLRVVISQDVDPTRFSDEEKASFVRDGDALFTTIAKRS